jgi:hypothetical protein
MIAVCACPGGFTACAPMGGQVNEGSSSPPPPSASHSDVFPPPALQVYD